MLRHMSNEPAEDIAGPEVRMGLGVMVALIVVIAIVTIVS